MRTYAPIRLLLLLLAAALLLAACGSGGGSGEPAAKVTHLKLGEPAKVRGSEDAYRISIAVDAKEGDIADLKGFDLEHDEQSMTPWYVTSTITNLGSEIGSKTVVTAGVDPVTDSGLEPKKIGLLGDFPTCELVNTPKPFAADASYKSCDVYLVKHGATLAKVAYKETRFEGANLEFDWKVDS
jgi:hypothetical protein